MAGNDPTQMESEAAIAPGAVRSIMYFLDIDGNPAPKSQAVRAEIHEFDADGVVIRRTYGTFDPS